MFFLLKPKLIIIPTILKLNTFSHFHKTLLLILPNLNFKFNFNLNYSYSNYSNYFNFPPYLILFLTTHYHSLTTYKQIKPSQLHPLLKSIFSLSQKNPSLYSFNYLNHISQQILS
jgi:hypothetical protein